MAVVPDDWTRRLASALAVAIREFCRPLGSEPVVCLDIGCCPWHGFIELSALTVAELDADPTMLSPREIASWRFYNFSDGVASWAATAELGKRMSQEYYAADDESRAASAEAFMRACATAAAAPQVEAAITCLPRDARFRVRVAHPDSGQEFGPQGV
jgi:hypothetical protein